MMRRAAITILVLSLFGASAVAARAATPPAATQPQPPIEHAYFPVKPGTTWKYRVSLEVADAPKPYVQTISAAKPIVTPEHTLYPIDGDLYELKPDGVYLAGRRDGASVIPFDEPRKLLSAKLRTSDTWAGGKGDSSYATCLGSQMVKTEAGEFTTQCVFVTVASSDGASQAQIYRYFARGVGLVRETISEKSKRADGSVASRQTTRELIAFTPAAAEVVVVEAPKATRQPIGADAVRGELLDPAGHPIAQAPLTLRRLDKSDEVQTVQTDFTGRFTAAGLDPAGSYVMEARLAGYEWGEVPLHSADRGPARAAITLKAAAAAPTTNNSADALFAAGKRLAADGDHKGAIAKYDEALALAPKNPAILAYKALSLVALGQAKQAEPIVEEALRLSDKDAQIWEVAGQVKVAQNQIDQGRSLFDKAAQLSPKTAGAIYLDLAAALAAKNDNKLAKEIESALKAAGSADPPSAEALFQLGQSYANAGKQEGKTYLQKYLEVSAKLPEAQQDKQKMQVAKQLIRALDIIKGK
jgi:cytochrome c-type biogenesis protein CcmH/NrfG